MSLTPTLCEAQRDARRSVPAPTYTKPPLSSPPSHPPGHSLPRPVSYRLQAQTLPVAAPAGSARSEHAGGSRVVTPETEVRPWRSRCSRAAWASVRVELCAVGCTLTRNRKNCGPVTWPEVTSVEGALLATSRHHLFSYSTCFALSIERLDETGT